MSWAPFAPTTRSRAVVLQPVTVKASARRPGTGMQTLSITARPSLVGDLAWWTKDRRVSVEVGSGEHAGRLRIAPQEAGVFRLTTLGVSKRAAPTLLLHGFPGLPPRGSNRTAVVADVVQDALVITLPPWDRGRGGTDAVAETASSRPAEKPSVAAPVAAPVTPPVRAIPAGGPPAPVTPGDKLRVLRALQEAGGTVRLDRLERRDTLVLRECQTNGHAGFDALAKTWRLTPAGMEMLAASAKVPA